MCLYSCGKYNILVEYTMYRLYICIWIWNLNTLKVNKTNSLKKKPDKTFKIALKYYIITYQVYYVFYTGYTVNEFQKINCVHLYVNMYLYNEYTLLTWQ